MALSYASWSHWTRWYPREPWRAGCHADFLRRREERNGHAQQANADYYRQEIRRFSSPQAVGRSLSAWAGPIFRTSEQRDPCAYCVTKAAENPKEASDFL